MQVKIKFEKFLVLSMLSLVMLVSTPIVADASPAHYAAVGQGVRNDGTWMTGYGVYCNTYMYPKQSSQDGDWVNSLYAGQWDKDFFEAGWYWRASDGQRIWFTAFVNGGQWYGETTFNGGSYSNGTWIPIQIRRHLDGTDNDDWDVYVNGTLRYTRYNTGTKSSYPQVGSERMDTLDYNKGSWKYVRYWIKLSAWDYSWGWWPDADQRYDLVMDPDYWFYRNRVDDANHWVYVDDHQN